MVEYSVILETNSGVPVGVAGFYDYDDAVDYASDWPGTAHVVDFATGVPLFTLTLVPGDDSQPS